jgi:hypothetical protein
MKVNFLSIERKIRKCRNLQVGVDQVPEREKLECPTPSE